MEKVYIKSLLASLIDLGLIIFATIIISIGVNGLSEFISNKPMYSDSDLLQNSIYFIQFLLILSLVYVLITVLYY